MLILHPALSSVCGGRPHPSVPGLSPLLRRFLEGLSLAGLLALALPTLAQPTQDVSAHRPLPAVRMPAEAKPPTIDGDLSDPVWQRAAKAGTFYDPQTDKPAPDQTEAYLLYDKDYIYAAFRCHDSRPNEIAARETVRDAELNNDDNVQLILDPFLTYKWEDYSTFTVNPLGTRNTRLGGGRAGKLEWQGDWDAAARRTPDGWTVEMRIPWAILSYPRSSGPITMGVNFCRRQQCTKINAYWSNLGAQFWTDREGLWQGVTPPTQAWRPRFSALPYLMPSGQATGGRSQFRSGVDLRYQPTPELTSVATINPDFATVEGAVESVGFTRSERYVPDKRPFFLEGSDYLTLGEDYAIGSFFESGRIQQLDTGMKLYGKLTPQTTLGMLGTISVGHEMNWVAHLRREFGPTTGANLMLLQRGAPGEDNTVGVLAAHSRKGKWSTDGEMALTGGPGAGGIAWTSAINLEDKNFFTTIRYLHVAPNFLDRLGFISFTDYRGWSSYTFWGAQWQHGPFRRFNLFFNPLFDEHMDGRPFRRRASLGVNFETRNDYRIGFHVEGGKFDNDTDFIYGFNIGGNVSNRFRRWDLSFTTGQQANLPYTSFGPSFNIRLFKKLDISIGSFIENYQGVTQQHILTFNYELSPYRAWGGRLVIENGGTNFFVSYRNSGRGGMDTYFIIGDPNAKSFVKRVMLKFVFAL
ncbi:MAG TPA: carbohydrate binding family 9 domain-containing protein [Chthonomonadaceae bacterium]|nr:carbohydrate binding family 9 domain-containing protein [Chthonomonadaceae bacterium]